MLLSITPDTLSVIFRAAGKTMMGAMVCKKLQALLPLHAKGLRWHIKELIPNAECDSITINGVSQCMKRWGSTRGLELCLSTQRCVSDIDAEQMIPGGGWATTTATFNRISTNSVSIQQINSYAKDIASHQLHLTKLNLGIDFALGRGFVTSLVVLDIQMYLNPANIIMAINSSSGTLECFKYTGLQNVEELTPSDVLNIGLALKNCSRLKSFKLEEVTVMYRTSITKTSQRLARYGATLTQITPMLLDACPNLTTIALCECELTDADIQTLVAAFAKASRPLEFTCFTSEVTWKIMCGALHHFKTCSGFDCKTEAELHHLMEAVKQAPQLKGLIGSINVEIPDELRSEFYRTCSDLGIELYV